MTTFRQNDGCKREKEERKRAVSDMFTFYAYFESRLILSALMIVENQKHDFQIKMNLHN